MKRILFFIVTNIAILLVLSIFLSLTGFTGILQSNGVDLDYDSLMIFSLVFGMGGSFISLYMSKWMAKKMAGVQVITSPSNDFEKWFLMVVKRQANILNIKVPEIGVFQSAGPNAFATGSSKNNSLVALSSGLISNMNREEIEAVIGHEMSHVANGDMVTLTLIQGIVNAFVIFFSRVIGHFVDRVILKNERGYGIGYFFTVIFAQVVLGILASTIVMWYSRQREYRADQGGAELTSKEAMIASLRALAKHSSAKLPDQMLAFGISNQGKKSFFQKYFSSHPPLSERIERLQQTNIATYSKQQTS
ncbi:MAG: protease HtpX [Gammaproteobacteria bacterium]|jgi:heat shock protein HtpX|nr:protease HtpX [Gammaproteobacteria bacterium]MBT4463000.1 protease HtpX [Gammaproteobacteria bacterium]MBT4654577.1 protease HtpX [Gammaproteobacteria bacterium]MBT5117115.1 protease HtpX [Gammaproteobacteria bacterium]MBT5761263.1 protease HtpX [Gammaproteobacteria bacterium]